MRKLERPADLPDQQDVLYLRDFYEQSVNLPGLRCADRPAGQRTTPVLLLRGVPASCRRRTQGRAASHAKVVTVRDLRWPDCASDDWQAAYHLRNLSRASETRAKCAGRYKTT